MRFVQFHDLDFGLKWPYVINFEQSWTFSYLIRVFFNILLFPSFFELFIVSYNAFSLFIFFRSIIIKINQYMSKYANVYSVYVKSEPGIYIQRSLLITITRKHLINRILFNTWCISNIDSINDLRKIHLLLTKDSYMLCYGVFVLRVRQEGFCEQNSQNVTVGGRWVKKDNFNMTYLLNRPI